MALKFSQPPLPHNTLDYLQEALAGGKWAGDGPFTARCHAWLGQHLGAAPLLTHSCTGALEMAALLSEVGPGDEVILPSFTFSSTANAFVLRGATPVFVDIRADTLNLDETLIEQALTPRTRVIVPVHYAGVACEMDTILQVARTRNLLVVEDAAQGLLASYRDKALGTIGDMGCFSFHVTKNVVSGEGGALVLNNARFLERALIIREKGTNRTAFQDRKIDKYDWQDIGSSYIMSDLLAALLLAQLEQAEHTTKKRVALWHRYHDAFAGAEKRGAIQRPAVPSHVKNNGHIYYLLLNTAPEALHFRAAMATAGIPAYPHYVPLHSAPAGRRYGRIATPMTVTDPAAACLVRLPLFADLEHADQDRVISAAHDALSAAP